MTDEDELLRELVELCGTLQWVIGQHFRDHASAIRALLQAKLNHAEKLLDRIAKKAFDSQDTDG